MSDNQLQQQQQGSLQIHVEENKQAEANLFQIDYQKQVENKQVDANLNQQENEEKRDEILEHRAPKLKGKPKSPAKPEKAGPLSVSESFMTYETLRVDADFTEIEAHDSDRMKAVKEALDNVMALTQNKGFTMVLTKIDALNELISACRWYNATRWSLKGPARARQRQVKNILAAAKKERDRLEKMDKNREKHDAKFEDKASSERLNASAHHKANVRKQYNALPPEKQAEIDAVLDQKRQTMELDEDDDEPVVKLEWLYVAEEFRGMHVADDLMASMYHTVSQAGIHAVTADVPAEGLLPVSICDFLSSWHILFSLEPMEYHIAPLEELRKDAVFPAGISTEGIYENYEPGKFIAFSYEGRDAELVFDIRPSGTLAVSGISADNEKETCALLSRALDRCCELFEPDTMVYMEPESQEAAALVDKLIPGHGVRLHLVGANVTEHADITGEVFEDMRMVYRQQASA